jgi:hypothetical protein
MSAESFNDALIECVKHCGGSKVVGVELWPAKGIEAAQRHLLACLNDDRNEKLSPDEALHVMRLARERGCHAAMNFLAKELGYGQPMPVDRSDAAAELHRQYIEATRMLARLAERIEKTQRLA